MNFVNKQGLDLEIASPKYLPDFAKDFEMFLEQNETRLCKLSKVAPDIYFFSYTFLELSLTIKGKLIVLTISVNTVDDKSYYYVYSSPSKSIKYLSDKHL